ncbi:MAG: hypothetical protein M1833_000566 [Piccolia ochrophora]|nr:MAG: hypothetical protein M1833_000566 [Piccolia ochrophora]
MPPQLSPPGSSSYSSSSMHVGDGTWDASRNTLLLPNLVGLNFDTMRYNGMGNRFKDLPQYHKIVRGHGVIAAITFLLIVPSAIMIARFHTRRPKWAMRLHIWLQVITVFLSTVVLILGWFAVGPRRSLTNPHHGIGVAIYVLILLQAIGGRWVYGREKGKMRARVPLKVILHQWSGRFIALLGIAQVPLGLTLYGSPLSLFVLYTLAVFILVLAYFILSYRQSRHMGMGRRSSYSSGTEVIDDRSEHRHSRLGKLAGVGAAGAGFAALNKLRHRSRSRSRSRGDVVGSRHPSGSYIKSEKYSDRGHEGGGWKDRLLKVGAVAGAAGLARNLMNRGKDREHDTAPHTAPLRRAHSISEDSLSRVEEGRPPTGPHHPHAMHRRSQSFDSGYEYSSSISESRAGRGHKLRNRVATMGAFGLVRAAMKNRRERKEQRRLDDMRRRDMDDERLARQASQGRRYTGDGFPRRAGRRGSLTSTEMTQTDVTGAAHPHGLPPPVPTGLPPPVVGQAPIPAGPPMSQGVVQESGSEEYVSASGRSHRRHHADRDVGRTGTAPGLNVETTTQNELHRSGESVATPPVSVKVRMHNDGRHVTLRKLSEQEAAAERETRRRERGHSHGRRRHRRNGSESDLSGAGASDHWRRVEDRERRQAEQGAAAAPPPVVGNMAAQAGYPPPPPVPTATAAQAGYPLPPPPPIPAAGVGGASSVGSPGTVTTDASGDHASRRQRRRAERMQQYNRRAAGTVEYE